MQGVLLVVALLEIVRTEGLQLMLYGEERIKEEWSTLEK